MRCKYYGFDGYNNYGFNEKDIHKNTQTKFDEKGFDAKGKNVITGTNYDIYDFTRDGVHLSKFERIYKNGFRRDGIHNETNNLFNKNGFDKNEMHKSTGSIYDENGFTIDGIYLNSKAKYNYSMLDINGKSVITNNKFAFKDANGKNYISVIKDFISSNLCIIEYVKVRNYNFLEFKIFIDILKRNSLVGQELNEYLRDDLIKKKKYSDDCVYKYFNNEITLGFMPICSELTETTSEEVMKKIETKILLRTYQQTLDEDVDILALLNFFSIEQSFNEIDKLKSQLSKCFYSYEDKTRQQALPRKNFREMLCYLEKYIEPFEITDNTVVAYEGYPRMHVYKYHIDMLNKYIKQNNIYLCSKNGWKILEEILKYEHNLNHDNSKNKIIFKCKDN